MRNEVEQPLGAESQEKDESSIGAEPIVANEAVPAVPLDEPDRRHADANTGIGLPVKAAATTSLAGSANNQRRPRNDLLDHQLNSSVTKDYSQEIGSKLRKGTLDLYFSLAPRDAIDSMVAGALVGLSNLIMDCFDQATRSGERAK
jgi:hypothetical protein